MKLEKFKILLKTDFLRKPLDLVVNKTSRLFSNMIFFLIIPDQQNLCTKKLFFSGKYSTEFEKYLNALKLTFQK